MNQLDMRGCCAIVTGGASGIGLAIAKRLAQIGSPLIDGVAMKMPEDFFDKFNATVAPRTSAAPRQEPGGITRLLWAAGAFALLLRLLYLAKKA
jgi:NAD(P)-dependent dehydrogenase (short-subunit alcohol dehydrogenase family)